MDLTIQDEVTLGIAAFFFACTAGMFVIWRGSRKLRDALDGQDGHRLMVIFTNIFAIDVLLLFSTGFRTIMAINDDQWLIARQIIGVVTFMLFMAVHVWALISVRSLIKTKNDLIDK